MKRRKGKCLICGNIIEDDDCLYATIGAETMVFRLCGEHAMTIACFLEESGLAERTSIPWRDALEKTDYSDDGEPAA